MDLLSNLADWNSCRHSPKRKLVGAAALDVAWWDLDSEHDLDRRICRRYVGVACVVDDFECGITIVRPSRACVVKLQQTSKDENAAKCVIYQISRSR